MARLFLFSVVQLRPRRTGIPYEYSICYRSNSANPPPTLPRRSHIYYIPVERDIEFQAMATANQWGTRNGALPLIRVGGVRQTIRACSQCYR